MRDTRLLIGISIDRLLPGIPSVPAPAQVKEHIRRRVVLGTILSHFVTVVSDPFPNDYISLSERILTSDSVPVVPIMVALFRNVVAILTSRSRNHMSALWLSMLVSVMPNVC